MVSIVKRKTRMSRTTRLRRRGRPRYASFAADKPYRAWIRSLSCLVAFPNACDGRMDAAHVTSRGAGGQDAGNLVPLCHGHHMLQHAWGIETFQQHFNVDLRATAERLWAEFVTERGSE